MRIKRSCRVVWLPRDVHLSKVFCCGTHLEVYFSHSLKSPFSLPQVKLSNFTDRQQFVAKLVLAGVAGNSKHVEARLRRREPVRPTTSVSVMKLYNHPACVSDSMMQRSPACVNDGIMQRSPAIPQTSRLSLCSCCWWHCDRLHLRLLHKERFKQHA
jgi:hypothetical protein